MTSRVDPLTSDISVRIPSVAMLIFFSASTFSPSLAVKAVSLSSTSAVRASTPFSTLSSRWAVVGARVFGASGASGVLSSFLASSEGELPVFGGSDSDILGDCEREAERKIPLSSG